MIDSPCHHCARCPCKEHDTCEDYIKYRAELERIRLEKNKYTHYQDYVHKSIDKRKRKERYK